MNQHSIAKLKCPCFLFRYPNLDIPSQALFNLHRASALPLKCRSEDNQNFQSPPGHSKRPVTLRRYDMLPVQHSGTYIHYYAAFNTSFFCTYMPLDCTYTHHCIICTDIALFVHTMYCTYTLHLNELHHCNKSINQYTHCFTALLCFTFTPLYYTYTPLYYTYTHHCTQLYLIII